MKGVLKIKILNYTKKTNFRVLPWVSGMSFYAKKYEKMSKLLHPIEQVGLTGALLFVLIMYFFSDSQRIRGSFLPGQ
jgi:hypothetical protein